MLPAIFSLAGLTVTPDEARVFRTADPVGFIIFARNIDTPAQTRALVAELKNIVGRDCPVLIDQEGGRIQRLKAPHWPHMQTFAHFGDLYADNPAQARAQLKDHTHQIAAVLNDLGVNVNCSPVLDLRYPGAHDIIGDRAFSSDPRVVADLGDVVCRAYLEHGIIPILKHAPGHGRALADSHLELPTVDVPLAELDATDFYPFRAISAADYAPQTWMMTAHILYPQIDPDWPATLSPTVMQQVVRERIGYPGVIIGDDMDMKALDSYGDILTRCGATLAAGCDLVLNCHGKLADMEALADGLAPMGPEGLKRLAPAGFAAYAA